MTRNHPLTSSHFFHLIFFLECNSDGSRFFFLLFFFCGKLFPGVSVAFYYLTLLPSRARLLHWAILVLALEFAGAGPIRRRRKNKSQHVPVNYSGWPGGGGAPT